MTTLDLDLRNKTTVTVAKTLSNPYFHCSLHTHSMSEPTDKTPKRPDQCGSFPTLG